MLMDVKGLIEVLNYLVKSDNVGMSYNYSENKYQVVFMDLIKNKVQYYTLLEPYENDISFSISFSKKKFLSLLRSLKDDKITLLKDVGFFTIKTSSETIKFEVQP